MLWGVGGEQRGCIINFLTTFLQLSCNFLQNQSITGLQLSSDFEAKGPEVYCISLSSAWLKDRTRSCKIYI